MLKRKLKIIILILTITIGNVNAQYNHLLKNSEGYIKIFDGFLLSNTDTISSKITINSVKKIVDNKVYLNKLGLQSDKLYLIITSEMSDMRRLIYIKSNIENYLYELNIPIVLNGVLITPDKYHLLNDITEKSIKKISYKKPPIIFNKKYNLPFGAIWIYIR